MPMGNSTNAGRGRRCSSRMTVKTHRKEVLTNTCDVLNGAGGHCVASLQQKTSENLWFSDVFRCKVAVSRSNFKPKGSPESSEYDD